MKVKKIVTIKVELSRYELSLVEAALLAYAEKTSVTENEKDCLLMAATLGKLNEE